MKSFLAFFCGGIFTLGLSSCSLSWEKLDPTYIEPTLGKTYAPTPIVMPDGRDISGYPIPSAAPTQTTPAKVLKQK